VNPDPRPRSELSSAGPSLSSLGWTLGSSIAWPDPEPVLRSVGPSLFVALLATEVRPQPGLISDLFSLASPSGLSVSQISVPRVRAVGQVEETLK
jgi:hypothetical protein